MSSRSSAPLPMRPAGLFGRAFGVAMEWLNSSAYRLALDMLGLQLHESVLEIGFGTGRLIEMLADNVRDGRVAGVDPTETMVEVARKRRRVRAAADRIELRLGDATDLPWASESFDAAVALHCFQFWPEPANDLKEIRRVLRPGGRLAIILRSHGRKPPAWLPNPISRSSNEIEGARTCIADAGFELDKPEIWPAHAILARRARTA